LSALVDRDPEKSVIQEIVRTKPGISSESAKLCGTFIEQGYR
jgi:hypothetical protein